MATKALVVEGGAMRGIFASGVLDSFLVQNYHPFDFVIGVSAGASNLIGYLSKQPKRSYSVITKLATAKRFYNPSRFVKGGNLIDVKWLFDESNRRFPVQDNFLESAIPFFAAVTNIETGNADYYRVTQDNFSKAIEATTALPIAYKHTPCFSGGCYTDGGVADSIPVKEAYRRGATDITVILSHPLSYEMPQMKNPWIMKKILSRHPKIAKSMILRANRYNDSLDFIRNPPKGVTIRVIAPDETFAVQRLTMNRAKLDRGYEIGLQQGNVHLDKMKGTFGLTDENCHFCI